MRIYQAENYKAMSRRAANIISAQVIYKPNCVLGLATGGTPVGLYQQLVEWYKKGDLSFAETRSVNLDEYLGLSPHHEQSYRYFMQDNLFDHIDIHPENTHVLNGLAKDPDAECAAYNKLIAELGGIDLQLLGMGHNGHIAFNEPGDDFGLETHVVDLTESTIEANKRFFESRDEVPPRPEHGYQEHHERPPHPDGGQRRGKGGHCLQGVYGPRDQGGSRLCAPAPS